MEPRRARAEEFDAFIENSGCGDVACAPMNESGKPYALSNSLSLLTV